MAARRARTATLRRLRHGRSLAAASSGSQTTRCELLPRTVHISHHPRYPPHTLHVLHTPPAATEWRGSPSLEAPFRLRGKPYWVLCASGNPPGCRIGGYAVLHPSGKLDIPCECVQKRVCQMRSHLHTLAHTNASPSDSCVRVVACYADFCVFLRAGDNRDSLRAARALLRQTPCPQLFERTALQA